MASTEASIPTLRSWSAAVFATATEVGSFAATPMASQKVRFVNW